MRIKYYLAAFAVAAGISACEDTGLPEWDYDEMQNTQTPDVNPDNGVDVPDPEPEPEPEPEPKVSSIDSVWFEIYDQKKYTPQEYMDKILESYPELESKKSLILSMSNSSMEINTFAFRYKSADESGSEVTLSALLVMPVVQGGIVKQDLVIDNRPTQTSYALMPSNSPNILEVLSIVGHPIVAPDLLGYGESKDRIMSYCCRHLAARNTVDAAMAAQYMLSSNQLGNLIYDPLPIYNIGYSQGGYDALALLRYMEKEATDLEKKALPIRQTMCGGGPYELRVFQKDVVMRDQYMYNPFLLMSSMSLLAYHPDKLSGFGIQDFVTERVIEKQLPELIQSGQLDNTQLIGWSYLELDAKTKDFFSESMLDPESELCTTLMDVLAEESLITDWKPKGTVWFYHATNDDCVPVACTKEAEKAFSGLSNCTFEYDSAPKSSSNLESVHMMGASNFYTNVVTKMIVGGLM